MIFVTVGTQMPFDRLVSVVNDWVTKKEIKVVAQIGKTEIAYKNIDVLDYVNEEQLYRYIEEADLVVAHAGMGTILSAMTIGKPLIIMPRSAAKGEHRNNHQYGTASKINNIDGVHVAWDEEDLLAMLDIFEKDSDKYYSNDHFPEFATQELLKNIRNIINQ